MMSLLGALGCLASHISRSFTAS